MPGATQGAKYSLGELKLPRAAWVSLGPNPFFLMFSNYKQIDRDITTADGRTVKAIGMGDMHLELPNGSKKTKVTFNNAIHAPEMAFTLISISRLDKAGYSVIFKKGMCTIKNKAGRVIATIPHSDGLYRVVAPKEPENKDYANVTSEKMTISEAHRKFGHIAHAAIKHAISNGFVTGIELDAGSKPEFCEACAKAKSARQPFSKESHTRETKYGERVHWDLWGPASVRSLNGNSYVAARIDDVTLKRCSISKTRRVKPLKAIKRMKLTLKPKPATRLKSYAQIEGENSWGKK